MNTGRGVRERITDQAETSKHMEHKWNNMAQGRREQRRVVKGIHGNEKAIRGIINTINSVGGDRASMSRERRNTDDVQGAEAMVRLEEPEMWRINIEGASTSTPHRNVPTTDHRHWPNVAASHPHPHPKRLDRLRPMLAVNRQHHRNALRHALTDDGAGARLDRGDAAVDTPIDAAGIVAVPGRRRAVALMLRQSRLARSKGRASEGALGSESPIARAIVGTRIRIRVHIIAFSASINWGSAGRWSSRRRSTRTSHRRDTTHLVQTPLHTPHHPIRLLDHLL